MTDQNTFYIECSEPKHGKMSVKLFSSDPTVSTNKDNFPVDIGIFDVSFEVGTYAFLQQCDVLEIDRTAGNRSVTFILTTAVSFDECANKLKEGLNG